MNRDDKNRNNVTTRQLSHSPLQCGKMPAWFIAEFAETMSLLQNFVTRRARNFLFRQIKSPSLQSDRKFTNSKTRFQFFLSKSVLFRKAEEKEQLYLPKQSGRSRCL